MALPVSSWYGPRVNPVTHQAHTHQGIDLPAPTGTPVYAARPGVVVRVEVDGVGKGATMGNAVCIGDPTGLRWWYMHLSKVLVTLGQQVHQAQLIGRVGSTGRSTGPHLHFGVALRDGRTVDPVPYFPAGTFRSRT